jgi:DNA processing protein
MESVTACVECLRRSWLLAALAPYIEKVNLPSDPQSLLGLLTLPNEMLVERVAPKVAVHLLARTEALHERKLHEELDAAGCWSSCRHSDTYPIGLHDAEGAPWALFGRGDRQLLENVQTADAVAIVGSRRATSYGREVARELGRELADAGLLVASGLGFGVEGCAHRGALEKGPTAAVLPCGPDIAYPAAHRGLWRQISEKGGVFSELPPGSPPWRWTFAARDRVLAALAGMTVVVEAADEAASMRIADLAIELGRDIGAVPGPITSRASQGPNALLAAGACVVRDGQDVVDALVGPDAAPRAAAHGREGTVKALGFSPSRPAGERAVEAFEDMRDDLETAVRNAASPYVGVDEWDGVVDPVLLENLKELLTAVLRQSIESADDSDSRFPALALVEPSDPDSGGPEVFPGYWHPEGIWRDGRCAPSGRLLVDHIHETLRRFSPDNPSFHLRVTIQDFTTGVVGPLTYHLSDLRDRPSDLLLPKHPRAGSGEPPHIQPDPV